MHTVYALLGSLFVASFLSWVVFRLFKEDGDYVRVASLCTFLCAFAYLAVAFVQYEKSASINTGVITAAVACVGVYVVLGFFAIGMKEWARKAIAGALSLHILYGLALVLFIANKAPTEVFVVVMWLALGAVGLFAALHTSTRKAISA